MPPLEVIIMNLNDEEGESVDFDDGAVIPFEACSRAGRGKIFAAFILALTLIALLIAVLCLVRADIDSKSAQVQKENTVNEEYVQTWQGVFSNAEISERCLSVCVSIRLGAAGAYSAPSSTGIVISSDGWILSSEGILNIAQIGRYFVKMYDGSEYAVQTVKRVGESNLALMKIDASGLETAELGQIGSISAGQSAVAISASGSPYHDLLIRPCVLSGTREVGSGYQKEELLRTDIEFGASEEGSPVFDREGRVLGIALYKNEKVILAIDSIRDKIENAE